LRHDKVKAIDALSEPYFRAWVGSCTMKMQERLPRELRDMIHEYMWLPDEHKKLDPIIQRRYCCQPGPVWTYGWESMFDYEQPECTCFSFTYDTHLMDPYFAGGEPAREIAEAWCRVKTKLGHDVVIGPLDTTNEADSRLEDIVYGRLLHVGMDVSTVIRKLHFQLDLDALDLERPENPMEDQPPAFQDEAERKAFFDPLHRIKRKSGFRLVVELRQTMINLNRWEEGLSILGSILRHFQKEGVEVWFSWHYEGQYGEGLASTCEIFSKSASPVTRPKHTRGSSSLQSARKR
jgi:hypothetical protein